MGSKGGEGEARKASHATDPLLVVRVSGGFYYALLLERSRSYYSLPCSASASLATADCFDECCCRCLLPSSRSRLPAAHPPGLLTQRNKRNLVSIIIGRLTPLQPLPCCYDPCSLLLFDRGISLECHSNWKSVLQHRHLSIGYPDSESSSP